MLSEKWTRVEYAKESWFFCMNCKWDHLSGTSSSAYCSFNFILFYLQLNPSVAYYYHYFEPNSRVQTLPKNGKACPVIKAFALLTEAIDHVLTCLIVFAFLFLALQSWFHQSRSTRYIRFNSIPFKLLFVLCRFVLYSTQT